jgi:hypothetical protein
MKSRVVLGGWVTVCAMALATSGLLAQEKKGEEKPPTKGPAGKEGTKGDTKKSEGDKEDPHAGMGAGHEEEMRAWMEAAKLTKEHDLLKQLAGKWKTECKDLTMGPEPVVSTGTSEGRLILGDRWLVSDYQSTMMDMPFEGHGMLGYDTLKKKYISTWSDNMGTGIMVSEGTANASGNEITLTGSWDDPMGKKHSARMIFTIVNPTKHTFVMFDKEAGGPEKKVMEITYTK